MRRLTLSATAPLLLLALAASPVGIADAAARPRRQCPTVKVLCPDTAVPDTPLPFDAEVNGAADLKLTYRWLVSPGKIVRGQGTPSIALDAGEPGYGRFEATVEVGGLPASCARTASCVTHVISDPTSRKFDEYGNLRFSDEKPRLDAFVAALRDDPSALGYIICYGGRVGRAGEARRRCERARNYTHRRRRGIDIEGARIVTVDGGYREELTVELYFIPRGAPPPVASPTVDPAEVKIIRSRPKRRKR